MSCCAGINNANNNSPGFSVLLEAAELIAENDISITVSNQAN